MKTKTYYQVFLRLLNDNQKNYEIYNVHTKVQADALKMALHRSHIYNNDCVAVVKQKRAKIGEFKKISFFM